PTELRARLFVAGFGNERRTIDDEPGRTAQQGDVPWVRVAPVPGEFDRAEAIGLASDSGLWGGRRTVAAGRGAAPEPVAVVLDARAVLQGRVVDEKGTVVPGAHVALQASSSRLESSKDTDGQGRFQMVRLPPLSGTLSVRSFRNKPQDVPVRLFAGQIAT